MEKGHISLFFYRYLICFDGLLMEWVSCCGMVPSKSTWLWGITRESLLGDKRKRPVWHTITDLLSKLVSSIIIYLVDSINQATIGILVSVTFTHPIWSETTYSRVLELEPYLSRWDQFPVSIMIKDIGHKRGKQTSAKAGRCLNMFK